MYYSIAVYPHREEKKDNWKQYMQTAAAQGFQEVFLSLHLPEFTVSKQVELLTQVAGQAKKLHMSLTVDVGGKQLKELLESTEYCKQIVDTGLDFVRLDYGYTLDQVRQIWQRWQVKGFVINASTYDRGRLHEICRSFRTIDEKIELRACHNYYPRPETGLSYGDFVKQNAILEELGIPVYSCIPDKEHPRSPLYGGLPTVEQHRHLALEQVVRQLAASPANVGFMAADESFSEENLRQIIETAKQQKMEQGAFVLRLWLLPGVSEEEKRIVSGQIHHIRYDSNGWILRSQSSRQMAEYAARVSPGRSGRRIPGMVTIDNQKYGRYSGELQIIKADLPADERVNLVGCIVQEDLWKLEYYRYGKAYRFEILGEIDSMKADDVEEMTALWNRNIPYCPVDEAEWASVVLSDENLNRELCLVIRRDGKMIGYAIGVVRRYPYLELGWEQARGWILALLVDQEYRGQGMGTYLLKQMEDRLYQNGCQEIVVASYSPYYFTAGVHQDEKAAHTMLQNQGYVCGQPAYWMERDLTDYVPPEEVLPKQQMLEEEGFRFIPFQSRYGAMLLDFVKDHFSPGWQVHIRRATQQRQLEDRCFLCLLQGKIVGYVQRGIGGDEYRYGPFGVAKEYRNRGLGTILVHMMWQDMKVRGLDHVYFRSTEEHGRRFYERQGMHVKGTYYHYKKEEKNRSL